METNEQTQVVEAAEAIRRYLDVRPNAAETVEGVARWWLARQRRGEAVALAQNALDRLEAEGRVVKFNLAGGKVMYRRA
ncbi:MAG TPA: hypothetical protein VJS66_05345 [Burkholderiales bacterium]|nr:hypothetical protein [Burkholderiales bacterium]